MNVVHAFSAYNLNSEEKMFSFKGNWSNAFYHYLSWILSFRLAEKNYPSVTLYTDPIGKKILIDALKLPYNEVVIVQNIPLWYTSVKLFALQDQKQPFVCIDSDVYLWQKLPDEIEKSKVFVQHLEKLNFESLYKPTLKKIKEVIPKTPLCWSQNITHSFNTGVVGGNNPEIFKEYWNQYQSILSEDNIKIFNKLGKDKKDSRPIQFSWNVVIEQYTFACILKSFNQKPNLLFEFEQNMEKEAYKLKFSHVMLDKNEETGERLRKRVSQDYTKDYENLQQLLRNKKWI